MASNLDQYAVGWGTLALTNANLAQLKGRSGFWWFVGSLIRGPVTTFFRRCSTRSDRNRAREVRNRQPVTHTRDIHETYTRQIRQQRNTLPLRHPVA